MLKRLLAFDDHLNKFCEYAGLFLLVCIIASSSLQVISRYIFNNSQTWTEEFARYCFIWMTAFGTIVCVRNNSHSAITIVNDMLKGNLKNFHTGLLYVCMLIAGFLFLFYGVRITMATTRQLSPTMHLPMCWVYLSVPFTGAGIIMNLLVNLKLLFSTAVNEEQQGGKS